MHALILLLICVFIGAGGQILLKKGVMGTSQDLSLLSQYLKMLSSPLVMMGLLLYMGGALLWLKVLQKANVSYAYPLFSMVYVLVALGSRFILKERFTNFLWVGIGLICMGVSVILFSQRPVQ
ncbi:TPA: transporter [bacterium]|nr:transporter [bacterium]